MAALIGGANDSTVSVDKKGITIRLPSQVFGKGWLLLLARLLANIVTHTTFTFPQRIMSSPDACDQAPRWIKNEIDGLSWLLFLLKVPKGHQLVSLWKVIDWAQINRLAAPYYHNANGGRPAWAPAQLVAMLILMFLYGIAHETTLIRLLHENIVWCWFSGFSLFGPYPTHDALYEFRKRVGKEGFAQILTLAVHACMNAGLVDNKLIHFDLTPTEASAHRWSPYERAVIVTTALIRYLELMWADQVKTEPMPEALQKLAAQVALETLPHKSLKGVEPAVVVESVGNWQQKADTKQPIWKQVTQQIVQELLDEEASSQISLASYCEVQKEPEIGPTSNQLVEESSKQIVIVEGESENGDLDEVVSSKTRLVTVAAPPNQSLDPSPEKTQENIRPVSSNYIGQMLAGEAGDPKAKADPKGEPATLGVAQSDSTIGTDLAKIAKKVICQIPHTRGDRDARVGRTTNYTWFCGYLMGFVVDDANQVITSVTLGAGNSKQALFLQPAIEGHIERVGKPESVAADSAFDDYETLCFLDDEGIVAHVTSRDHSKPKDGGYGTDRISWKEGEENPFCADSKALLPVGKVRKDGRQAYQGTACSSCKLYERCHPSGQGEAKKYRINPDSHKRWQENRQANQSEEYKAARRSRFVSEGRFGLAKNNHNADCAPYRSDEMNLIAAFMIASMMNFRILANNEINLN